MFSPIVSVHRWLDLWIRNCRYSGAAELTSATTWMNLQNMMLSERSQTPKTVHGRTPWIWNLQEFPLWCSRLRSWHATDWSWSQLRSDSWLGNFHKPWVWPKREKKLSRNSKCIETENEFVATGENGDWLQTGTRALWGIVEIFFSFLWLHLWHTEVPGLGVEVKLQATATVRATPDPSRICDLHRSLWQHGILNPLSEAGDRTCLLKQTMSGS